MNALALVFRTDQFNLSRVGPHFINPSCFGEDLATWLREKLRERSVEAREPYQEDWGWELPVKNAAQSYYLCMSGNSEGKEGDLDDGEWRVIVERKRSVQERFTGKGNIQLDDAMLAVVQEILIAEPGIRDIHLEPR
jgi:hypothetical protein